MSNFGGWLLVGLVMIGTLQLLDTVRFLEPRKASMLAGIPGIKMLGPVLYVLYPGLQPCRHFLDRRILSWGLWVASILFFPSLLVFFFTLYKNANLSPAQIAHHSRDLPLSEAPCPALSSESTSDFELRHEDASEM